MRQVCTLCGQETLSNNLWCHRVECSAENLETILPRGEAFDVLTIGDFVHALRAANVYEATFESEPVLVKISHRGEASGTYLKAEARLFWALQDSDFSHPALPRLIPRHTAADFRTQPGEEWLRAYGRTTHRGHLRYYTLFEPISTRFLRDQLNLTPQLPPRVAGNMVETLADLLLKIQAQVERFGYRGNDAPRYHHLALCPDVILVRTDAEGILRPLLFDLGLQEAVLTAEREDAAKQTTQPREQRLAAWAGRFTHPAYVAPDLFHNRHTDLTDIYGLSHLLYETLMGHSRFDFHTQTRTMLHRAIERGSPQKPFRRVDLDDTINMLVERGLEHDFFQRDKAFDKKDGIAPLRNYHRVLRNLWGAMPEEQPPRKWYQPSPQQWEIIRLLAFLTLILLATLLIVPAT